MTAPRGAAAPGTSGPALLVPVALDAVLLTMTNSSTYRGNWSCALPIYSRLSFYGAPDPQPFNASPPHAPGIPGFTGAILHWALPDGLTKGHHDGQAVGYPDLPNRWLVVRKAVPLQSTTWSYAAWLVASDYMNGPLGSQFPAADGSGAIALGMSWSLAEAVPDETTLQAHALTTPLTAVGPGDAAYAAYAPNLANVLSFCDPLSGVAIGPVSYAVYGWYAPPATDPLAGATTLDEWDAIMAGLGWSVGDQQDLDDAIEAARLWGQNQNGQDLNAAQPFPTRTVCHGQVYEFWWPGPQGPLISGVPPTDPVLADFVTPRVAFANSSVDALAALMGQAASEQGMSPEDVTTLMDVVEAVEYAALPLFDKSDGQAQLDLRAQQGWFNSTPGGTTWQVVDARRSASPSATTSAAPLTGDQSRELGGLNAAQRALDACRQAIVSWQWQLYALWWKAGAAKFSPDGPDHLPGIEAAIAQSKATLDALFCQQADLLVQRDAAVVALEQGLLDRILVAGTRPPFWRPNDPVVLVQGAGRGYRHGEDGRFTADGTLFCRFSGQTVSGLTVEVGGNPVTVGASTANVPAWPLPGLPPEIADLDTEAFFLDLTNAAVIAQAADPGGQPWALLGAIRQEQTLIWNPAVNPPLDQQTIAEASGLQTEYDLGALPSKIAVSPWSPPWSPLYIDWQLAFYPGTTSQTDAISGAWTLPSSPEAQPFDEFTYRWNGGSPTSSNVVDITGRTVLSPQLTSQFAAQISALIDAYGGEQQAQEDMWALQDALEFVQDSDLLSQALTGFHANLLDRLLQVLRAPGTSTADEKALAPYLDPPGGPAFVADSTPAFGAQENQFNALRGGHFQVQKLWVVDGFGQVFDVMQALDVQPVNFTPIFEADLVTASSTNLGELKPRLAASSRLIVDLLDATDDDHAVGVATTADPVCGWLILNRLDRSLLVYDASGDPLGELMVGAGVALWLPPPDRTPPPSGGASPVDIGSPHLRALVQGILDQPGSDLALEALLGLIENVSFSVDPGSSWADQELPVLLGRPLAVVRARLGFEIEGGLVYGQTWDDISFQSGVATLETGGYDQETFEVQLGSTELLDDGLVGFYLNDDYASINSVYAVVPANPYVAAGRPALPFSGNDSALLTLILDPQTSLHAITGFLPPLAVSLPPTVVVPSLNSMLLTFRTGPVISDPGAVALPVPALQEGGWNWLQYAVATAPAQPSPLVESLSTATLADLAPVLREGWLRLDLGQATRLTYGVSPGTLAASGAADTVVVTAYNGTGAGVTCSEIRISLPVGDSGSDLTADARALAGSVPKSSGWTLTADGSGNFTAQPVAPLTGLAAGATLAVTLAGIRVSLTPGTAALTVQEFTDSVRATTVQVTKVNASGGGPG